MTRAYSPKSRGARPSARRTPSCGSTLRPSSTSRNRNETSSASSRGHARLEHPGVEVVGRHADEAHVAAGRGGDLRRGLVEAQRARAGQLVDLAVVAVLGQRGDRDVGDVLDVDERLGHVARGQRDLARADDVGQERLAEVLREPAAAHDGPLGAGRDQLLLGALGLGLAAAGEQHEPLDAALGRQPRERADDLRRALDREVGEEGDVDRGRRRPARGPRWTRRTSRTAAPATRRGRRRPAPAAARRCGDRSCPCRPEPRCECSWPALNARSSESLHS